MRVSLGLHLLQSQQTTPIHSTAVIETTSGNFADAHVLARHKTMTTTLNINKTKRFTVLNASAGADQRRSGSSADAGRRERGQAKRLTVLKGKSRVLLHRANCCVSRELFETT